MKPLFSTLYKNYPRKDKVPREQLFADLGWEKLLNDEAFYNTCAIRVHLALIRSGVTLPGRLKILEGSNKGKMIEPGQGRLSHLLLKNFGEPEKFKAGATAERSIGLRNGIVSFWHVHPELSDTMGHIDIVFGETGGLQSCGTACYWSAKSAWFWPLK